MKSNLPERSSLRQLLDLLGTQIASTKDFDPNVVLASAQQLAFAAGDRSKPLPPDIFQHGIDDTLMRIALGELARSLARTVMQMRQGQPPISK